MDCFSLSSAHGLKAAVLCVSLVDPGCVKTLDAVTITQQKNRTCDHDESFMRERHSLRTNLARERGTGWFSHSQDPKRKFGI
jgi:hypothetical protein